jgi:F-type H+/Na+-transporting ATPase subunit alpha
VLKEIVGETFTEIGRVLDDVAPDLRMIEVGAITHVTSSIARVSGLARVGAEELLTFPGNVTGFALTLAPDTIGVVLLDEGDTLRAGDEVRRTGRVVDVPVGAGLIGRVVDALGRPLDDRGPIAQEARRPIERDAPRILDRAPVSIPLQTGLKAVDALIPIGRGQRELIVGDRQTGKTAVAIDTILNQRATEVIAVYCAIGQRASSVAKVIADLDARGALETTIVVVAGGEDPPGMQFIAPYAATTMAEHFMEQGRDVLIVYDDLTRHARAYRELSLLLRRPPGREAFPGDIFYIHSRLLERATHLRDSLGGGSLTALPIIETEAQNISAYIPTNLISITDGQIYLSPDLFQKGQLPAIDVGRSVSRVGGKAQLPAYRAAAGDLRLSYAQFEELEAFARFGTRLDEETRRNFERGRRVRETLRQSQYEPLTVTEQLAVLLAVAKGAFDDVPLERVGEAQKLVQRAVGEALSDVRDRIEAGEELSDADRQSILDVVRSVLQTEGFVGAETGTDADA